MDDDAPAGVPEWVVTYGDMMSLLLTFFIMLVSLSEIKNDKKYRAVLDALQKYVGYQTGPLTPPGKNFPLNSFLQRLDMLGSFTDTGKGTGGVKSPAPEGTDLQVLRTREGDAIRVGEPVLFHPAETTLSDEAKQQLLLAFAALAGKPNKVEIRAHASPDPLTASGGTIDKTEITYERARNVLLFLEKQGIEHDRLRITAAADIEPLPQTGDDRARHFDRAEILIYDALASDFVGPHKIPE
jgi:chemotaxis protein MotB